MSALNLAEEILAVQQQGVNEEAEGAVTPKIPTPTTTTRPEDGGSGKSFPMYAAAEENEDGATTGTKCDIS